MELDPDAAATVLATLDALEVADGVPRIEAAERRRLAARAGGHDVGDDEGWIPRTLADRWYLGLRTRARDGARIGEAGRLTRDGSVGPVLSAAAAGGAARLWLRGADADDVAAATAAGWHRRRELLVLGRPLPATGAVRPPTGLRLAGPDEVDDGAVAALLARAYAAPQRAGLVEADADAGTWTAERVARTMRATASARVDLLVGVDPTGAPVGLHWTTRRANGLGEVFNLAVDPDRTGHGVGGWLLAEGLAHLASAGLGAVVLWVDAANAPALALYRSAGFAVRGRDVALEP